MRGTSVGSTSADFASLRLRFADLHSSKCRRLLRVRTTLPLAVILKRFATDLRVLLRGVVFGMRKEGET